MIASGIISVLREFRPQDFGEAAHRDFILSFVLSHPWPFDRAHTDGHLTGSAVITDSEGERVLLGFHRKLGLWLQLGGHGEPGELDPEQVAMREAVEESGIHEHLFHQAAPRPFDLDVHRIPARGRVPEHLHLDLRYVLVAPPDAKPVHSDDEHFDMRWFTWDETGNLPLDSSLRRALDKVQRICGGVRRMDAG